MFFAVNQLDAHSDHVCYKTEAEAENGPDLAAAVRWTVPGASPGVLTPPHARRISISRMPDLTAFGTIRVPGHIELQGYGQIQYTNTPLPLG